MERKSIKKCLIVDDSRIIRKVARQILEPLGFEVREAENGLVGLEACREDMPQVILLDWNMPVMNGIEFIQNLRKEPAGNEPKVLFCTTENDQDHIREAIASGADEYIVKPFDEATLQVKLQLVGIH